jgi:hypothetical protein
VLYKQKTKLINAKRIASLVRFAGAGDLGMLGINLGPTWIFVDYFCKTQNKFNMGFLYGVFELASPINARKTHRKKTHSMDFVDLFVKSFRQDFLQKYFCGVFELPPVEKRPKTQENLLLDR